MKFDKEYSTQWLDEYEFLKKNGILPSFVKTPNENFKLITYKYTKNYKLFSCLADFYKSKL